MPTTKSSQGYVERFYEARRAELLDEKDVTEKKMFGTTALCTHDKVFMFPWKETLVLKLPEETVNKLLTSKSGELFDRDTAARADMDCRVSEGQEAVAQTRRGRSAIRRGLVPTAERPKNLKAIAIPAH
jgi:hypothetical protein